MGHKKVNIEEIIKDKKITKEEVINLYIEREYSIREISEYYSIVPSRVYKVLDFFSIKTRSIKEACGTQSRPRPLFTYGPWRNISL